MTSYRIAIEGGGTRSGISLINTQLKETCERKGPPLHGKRISLDVLQQRCEKLINKTVQNCDLSSGSVEGLAVALAGADRDNEQQNIRKTLRSIFPDGPIFVTSDVRASHVGAFNNRNGILVIAGTGSIVIGRNGNKWKRAGGYGHRLGDEGSGHLIGTEGLRAVGRDYDGQESTLLTQKLKEELSINSRDELIRWTYDADHSPSQLAPYVIRCAKNGDRICQSILKRQIEELIELIRSLSHRLDLEDGPLTYHGGLFDSPTFFSQFQHQLEKHFDNLSLSSPQYNPRVGVCIMMQHSLKQ